MSVVDWIDEAPTWTAFLRGQGFALGIDGDLLVARLAGQLGAEEVADAAAAARWFGPVLCRDADAQARLPELLRAWVAGREPAATPPPDIAPRIERAVRANAVADQIRRRPLRMALLAAAAMAALFAFLWWRARTPTPAPRPTAVQVVAAVQAVPPATSSPPLTRLAASLLAAAICGGLVVLWRQSQRRRAALLRGLVPRDARAAALSIVTPALDLFRAEGLRPALAELRRHRFVPAEWIDPGASVAATVARGGFATLVPGRRPELREHLLLVDLAGAGDILTVLADLIADRLRAGAVEVLRFDFRGDPRRLRRADGGGTTLDALRDQYPQAHVLVLSDAGGFGPPGSDRLRGWVDDLGAWQEVALLTPLPTAQWGLRERTLIRRGFLVVPATPPGLLSLSRLVRADLAGDRATPGRAWPLRLDARLATNPYTWLGDAAPEPSQVASLVADLVEVLDARAMLYFSALAVFPVVHPKLTLALGETLADADGRRLLDEATLAQLCRLPWLRQARIPDWLRLALVRRLQGLPDDEARVLAAVSRLLEPDQAGAEAAGLTLEVVRQETPGLASLVAGLLRRRPGPYREAILLAFLNREALPELALELPQTRARLLHEAPPWLLPAVTAAVVLVAAVVFAFADMIGGAVMGLASELLAGLSVWWDHQLAAALRGARVVLALAGVVLPLLALGSKCGVAWLPRRYMSVAHCFGLAVLGVAAQAVSLAIGGSFFDAGTVLLAAWVAFFVLYASPDSADRWAPLLVAFSVAWPGPYLYSGLPLLPPLVAWLALRHSWQQVRHLLWVVAPALLLQLPLPESFELLSIPARLIALGLMARFIADADYRTACLAAVDFGPREAAVLLLPFAVAVTLSPGGGIEARWYPDLLLYMCSGIIGLSRIPMARLLGPMLLAGCAGAFVMLLRGFPSSASLSARHLFESFWAFPTALVCFLSGRFARAAMLGTAKALAVSACVVLVVLAFALSLLLIDIPRLFATGRTLGTILMQPDAGIAAAAALIAMRPKGSIVAVTVASAGATYFAVFAVSAALGLFSGSQGTYFHEIGQVGWLRVSIRAPGGMLRTLWFETAAIPAAMLVTRAIRAAPASAPRAGRRAASSRDLLERSGTLPILGLRPAYFPLTFLAGALLILSVVFDVARVAPPPAPALPSPTAVAPKPMAVLPQQQQQQQQ